MARCSDIRNLGIDKSTAANGTGMRSMLMPVRAAFSRMRENALRRQGEQDLRSLPDHVLSDLGIGRSEILAAMRLGSGSDGGGQACGE